jgi:glycosyltransferase involved in cell wall biosynthesis
VKLACVVQRYGADIAGGSEAHCRELAERLAHRHDVTVLTTTARDYVTWKNAIPAGDTTVNGVRVVRFPVERPRRLKRFADLSDEVFDGAATREREEAWFEENGPRVPALLDHLREQRNAYDAVLFWTFRYYPSYFGLPIVADRALLVPTAEEDRAIDLHVLRDYFRKPAGYLFLTPEEEALVRARAGQTLRPSAIVGIGLEPAVFKADAAGALQSHGVPAEFVLYLGRIDRNKGCDTLFEYFEAYAAQPNAVPLVLAGPAKMRIPDHPLIRPLGYVTDAVRLALLERARALIVPSPYESLSIVLLEAWNAGTPALVNAGCKVLKGQLSRANGGLYYRSAREFTEALNYLIAHPAEAAAFGQSGREYVDREYRWPVVMARVEGLLSGVTARSAPATV